MSGGMTRGTPASSQILSLERQLSEREDELHRLHQENLRFREALVFYKELLGDDAMHRRIVKAGGYERLRSAAQDIVRRWHTPLWRQEQATAVMIQALERALAELEP